MTCCNHNCNQGRNCPVRQERMDYLYKTEVDNGYDWMDYSMIWIGVAVIIGLPLLMLLGVM